MQNDTDISDLRYFEIDLIFRKAKIDDLEKIITLLREDDLGKTRQKFFNENHDVYTNAFLKINNDENQCLIVVELNNKIVGTCHLTFMQSLTFDGSL